MQYLAIFTPKKKFAAEGMPADFMEMEMKEQTQAQVLYAEGGLRQVWALDTKEKGAAVLFEATSPDHLQRMIDSFPLIEVDYADYQVLPLAPYPAFAKTS